MTAGESLGSTFPISVVFVQGEQVTAGKLSGWANQTSAGLNRVAKALGDLWGEEFADNKLYVSTQRPAHIMNLARLIGPASALNPIRPVAAASRVEYDVTLDPGTIPQEVNEFSLRDDCNCEPPIDWTADYPLGAVTVHSSIETALNNIDGTVFSTIVSTKELVNGTGDYYVDTHGNVLTYTRTGNYSAVGDEDYQTTMAPDMYDQATLNVIPDMNQTTLCDVVDIGGSEYVVRTPFLTQLSRRNANNNPLTPGDDGCPPTSFTTTERARLPYALKATDGMYLSDGDQIPDGFMGLWDETNSEMIDGLTFKLSDEPGYSSDYCVIVTGATLIAGSTRYRLVTIGTTITETLSYLIRRFDTHDHSGRVSGYAVSHTDLYSTHIAPNVIDDASFWNIEVNSPPSVIANNNHPQYLCRYGWKSGLDAGQYDNAILGDLFIARDTSNYVSNSYDSTGADSHKIYFASSSRGPYLFYDHSKKGLVIDGDHSTDGRVKLITNQVFLQNATSSSNASIRFRKEDADTDEKVWEWEASESGNEGYFKLLTWDDTESTSTTIISLKRDTNSRDVEEFDITANNFDLYATNSIVMRNEGDGSGSTTMGTDSILLKTGITDVSVTVDNDSIMLAAGSGSTVGAISTPASDSIFLIAEDEVKLEANGDLSLVGNSLNFNTSTDIDFTTSGGAVTISSDGILNLTSSTSVDTFTTGSIKLYTQTTPSGTVGDNSIRIMANAGAAEDYDTNADCVSIVAGSAHDGAYNGDTGATGQIALFAQDDIRMDAVNGDILGYADLNIGLYATNVMTLSATNLMNITSTNDMTLTSSSGDVEINATDYIDLKLTSTEVRLQDWASGEGGFFSFEDVSNDTKPLIGATVAGVEIRSGGSVLGNTARINCSEANVLRIPYITESGLPGVPTGSANYAVGDMFYNTFTHQLYIRESTGWVSVVLS